MVALAALTAAAFLPTSPSCHANSIRSVRAQLDRDPAREVIRAVDQHDCAHTAFRVLVLVRDRCRGGWRKLVLLDEKAKLLSFRVVDVDRSNKRPEIFVLTSKSATVVRLVEGIRGRCLAPMPLYTYRPSPIPPGLRMGGFSVELADFSRAYRGLELRVTEWYFGNEPMPVTSRIRFYRYDRSQGRYVPYGSERTI